MPTDDAKVTIGYYTVTHDDRMGWTGGLLILNGIGRPLEFQCTLPVRPSRAHEILYGPTLRTHLISEVIGPLLISKSRTPLSILCCDQPESLALESHTKSPIALVCEAAEEEEGPDTDQMLSTYGSVEVAGSQFSVAPEQIDAVQRLSTQLSDLPDAVEPFQRIREAIQEAHSQIARQDSAQAA